MGALSKMSVLSNMCIIHEKIILTFYEILKSSQLEYRAGYNKIMEPYASIVKKQLAQILEKEPNAVLIEKNIIVLKNWLSDDLCDRLVNHVESFGEDIWWDKNKREWWHGKFFFVEDPELDEMWMLYKYIF